MTETIKISQLPNAGVLSGTERVAIVQSGTTKVATTAQIGALYSAGGGSVLLRDNNLSDVESVTTSRTNLGLGDTDSPQFANVRISGAAGSVRSVQIETGGADRWTFGGSSAAETGTNAGTNFFLNSFNDSGVYIETPLSVTRSSGLTTLKSLLSQTTIDLGNTTDTTLSRASAGIIAVEGNAVALSFDTRSAAASATLPAGLQYLRTQGYASVGDLGAGLYERDVSLTSGGFQSADGAYWTLVPDDTYSVYATQFGVKADNSTDNTVTLQAFVDYLCDYSSAQNVGRSIRGLLPAGTIKSDGFTITRACVIQGCGAGATRLSQNAGLDTSFVSVRVAFDTTNYYTSGNPPPQVSLIGLRLTGQGWSTGFSNNHGLDLQNASVNPITTEVILQDFRVQDFPGHNITGVSFTGWVEGYAVSSGYAGLSAISANSCADWLFINPQIYLAQRGVLLSGCVNMQFYGINIYSNREDGIYIFESAAVSGSQNVFTAGSIDRNQSNGVFYDGRTGKCSLKLVGVTFAQNSASLADAYSDVQFSATSTGSVAFDACNFWPTNAQSASASDKTLYHLNFTAGTTGTAIVSPSTTYLGGALSTNTLSSVSSTFPGSVRIGGASIAPLANDGSALGTSALGFSDRYMATGAVDSWGNGNMLLTHSAETLAINGTSNPKVITGANAGFGGPGGFQYGLQHYSVAGSAQFGRFSADANPPVLAFSKSRNATVGSQTIVNSGDKLGAIYGYGSNGTGYDIAAAIEFLVDGTPGASNDMPGRIVFSTTANGAASATNHLIIDNAGVLKPATNGGVALGTGALSYSALYMNTATAISFGNGNLTLTHSTGALAITGVTTLASATATPAGGSTSACLIFGTTSGFGIYYGSGAPTVSAAQGSLYLRSDGSGVSDRAYINNSAGSGTAWTALTTAA